MSTETAKGERLLTIVCERLLPEQAAALRLGEVGVTVWMQRTNERVLWITGEVRVRLPDGGALELGKLLHAETRRACRSLGWGWRLLNKNGTVVEREGS